MTRAQARAQAWASASSAVAKALLEWAVCRAACNAPTWVLTKTAKRAKCSSASRLHLINASAVAKVFNLASNIGSFVTFAFADKVLYSIGIPIAAANLVGGYVGSVLAIQKGQRFIQVSLLIVFGILFLTLINRIWQG